MGDNLIKTEEKEVTSPSIPIFDRGEALAKRMEEANRKAEELIRQQESIIAKIALGGKADAGFTQPQPAPLSAQEYSKKILRGEVSPFE